MLMKEVKGLNKWRDIWVFMEEKTECRRDGNSPPNLCIGLMQNLNKLILKCIRKGRKTRIFKTL